MRLRSIDPLVDLLPDRGVEAVVAFGKPADPEMTVATRQSRRGNTGQVEFRGGGPTDTAGDGRIVGAAEDAARILPGKHSVDAGHPIVMAAEAAHLRQETRRWAILGELGSGPGAGRVVAAEYSRRPGQVPVRRDQQRHRRRQARGAAVGREGDFFEGRDGEIARATIQRPLVEAAIDPPPPTRSVENQDLCALRPFRPGLVLSIAICRHRACRHARRGRAFRCRP